MKDGGARLVGEARKWYRLAIECLESAKHGNQMRGWEERRRDFLGWVFVK